GDVAAIVSTVSNVAIDEQIRLPLAPQVQPRTRFGRVGFHVVAIEVLIGAGGTPAHVDRTVLVDPIVRTGSFMTVGVVDGNKQQHDVVQYSVDGLRDGDIAQQGKASVFTVGFTGVNTRLDQDDGLA